MRYDSDDEDDSSREHSPPPPLSKRVVANYYSSGDDSSGDDSSDEEAAPTQRFSPRSHSRSYNIQDPLPTVPQEVAPEVEGMSPSEKQSPAAAVDGPRRKFLCYEQGDKLIKKLFPYLVIYLMKVGACATSAEIDELNKKKGGAGLGNVCLLYTSPSPRDGLLSRMPSSA